MPVLFRSSIDAAPPLPHSFPSLLPLAPRIGKDIKVLQISSPLFLLHPAHPSFKQQAAQQTSSLSSINHFFSSNAKFHPNTSHHAILHQLRCHLCSPRDRRVRQPSTSCQPSQPCEQCEQRTKPAIQQLRQWIHPLLLRQ